MRGTLPISRQPGFLSRIIPADAGNTKHPHAISPACADHPRGCGEHSKGDERQVGQTGSSPRMRGTLGGYALGAPSRRIIPADAGNTHWLCFRGLLAEDHPRGCGEHASQVAMPLTVTGSSPRMRGTPFEHSPGLLACRIIPADAGNTFIVDTHSWYRRDHPRGCGEHRNSRRNCASSQGSSPRMRGAPIWTFSP